MNSTTAFTDAPPSNNVSPFVASPTPTPSCPEAEQVPEKLQSVSLASPIVIPKANSKIKLILKDNTIKFGTVLTTPNKNKQFKLIVKAEGVWSAEKSQHMVEYKRDMTETISLDAIIEIHNFGRGEFPLPNSLIRNLRPREVPPPPLQQTQPKLAATKKRVTSPAPLAPGRALIVDAEDSDLEEEVDEGAIFEELKNPMLSKDAEKVILSAKSGLAPVVESVFRRSHSKTPLVATMKGSDLVQWLKVLKPKPEQSPEWLGYAQSTMQEHKRSLLLMASNVDPDKALPEALIAALETIAVARKWRWSTWLKKAATVQGALAMLPLYYEGCPSLYLKEYEPWVKELSHLGKKTKEEVPTQAQPATKEEVDKAVQRFRAHQPHIAVAIMIGWLTAARLGCILQLEVKDVICTDSRLAITFRRGKGVRRRGPYTVDTQPLPPLWKAAWQAYVKKRAGSRLFPATLQGSDLCSALRKISPNLEQRSIRRGALQTMAANGVDEETLMRFSGHTQVNTLRRYLNWNTVNSNVQQKMATAAVSLVPTPPTGQPRAQYIRKTPEPKKAAQKKRSVPKRK